jgi:Zn-dependent protease
MEPPETGFDLRWRMLGVRVRVHPFFWLAGALLGWPWYEATGNVLLLLMWIAVVFVSILIHEFGHVLVGWYFGSKGHVILYMFGGLAVGSNRLSERWQRILVSLAGPGAQLVLLGIVAGMLFLSSREPVHGLTLYGIPLGGILEHPYLVALAEMLIFVNLFWPLLNLLPIFPLDGGQVSREICEGVSPGEGTRFALGISMVLAGVVALHFFLGDKSPIPIWRGRGLWVNGLLFAMLAASSFQMMQAITARRRGWDDDHLPWER